MHKTGLSFFVPFYYIVSKREKKREGCSPTICTSIRSTRSSDSYDNDNDKESSYLDRNNDRSSTRVTLAVVLVVICFAVK